LILLARIKDKKGKYLLELKHWKEPKRVGTTTLRDFLKVVVQDDADQGLVLSTSGFTKNAISQLTQLGPTKLRMGGGAKIIGLCRTYVQKRAGLWSPEVSLSDVLFEATVQ
jgi:restriction endonuclease Mrr